MAARKRLTDSRVRDLKPQPKRYELWDGNGFGIRVTPRGVKSFVWIYRFKGTRRRVTLGQYPQMSLAAAKAEFARAQERLSEDGDSDPGRTLQEAQQADRHAANVSTLAESYIVERVSRKRSGAEDERIIRKEVIPTLGTQKARNVTRGEVKTLLNAIVLRGAPVMANRVLAVIRAMYGWALYEEKWGVTTNPAKNIKPPGGKEKSRTRVLSSTELRSFWNGLDAAKMTGQVRLALRLQTVLLQRKGEIVNAEWAEFDLVDRLWRIPRKKAKNDEEHVVPLSYMALTILEEVKALSGKSRWLFPSPHRHNSDSHITGGAISQAMLTNRDVLGLENATPHDLRRTGSSTLTSMKVPRLVVDKILNHADTGVSAVYDTYSYMDEKRDALNLWAKHLQVVLSEDKKVVQLGATA